jgi:RHS repeat-associated protein
VATTTAGAVAWRAAYQAFGFNTGASGLLTQNLRFPGQYADAETGDYQNGARDYDPTLGRYLETDRIGLLGGINTFAYASSNPIGTIDRTGLCPPCIVAAVEGVEALVEAAEAGEVVAEASEAATAAEQARAAAVVEGTAVAIDELAKATAHSAPSSARQCDPSKRFSPAKQALVDMAKGDKRTGMTPGDMQAYKDLNKELPDPFGDDQVRGPEAHDSGAPTSQAPHGHIGPVDHIPIN